MAISHIKSNTIADFTGTVTVFNSVGSTVTANATDIVRPSDWNSVHNQFMTLSGNTANSSNISGSNIIFQGGNNITLSGVTAANVATVVISAANQTVDTNKAGTGFTTTTAAGVVMVGTNDTNGLKLGVPAYITTAMQSNAATISNVNWSAGTTSQNLSNIKFADSNGISFGIGTGANSTVITGTVQTNYLTTARGSTDAIGLNTALTANGVSMTANSSGLSLNFPAFLTTAAQSSASNVSVVNAATNNTGGGTATLSGGISFSNANSVTFYTSAGNAIVASVSFPAAITTANYYFAGNTTGQSSSSAGNDQSISFSALGIISAGMSAGQIILSVPSGGGAGDGGNTLAVAGSTAGSNSLVLFSNSPTVTFGMAGNTITASAAGGGGAGYTQFWFAPEIYGNTLTSAHANGTVYLRPFEIGGDMDVDQYIFQQSFASSLSTYRMTASISAGNASSGTATWGQSGTVLLFSRMNTNETNASYKSIITYASDTYSIGAGYSASCSWSTNVSSATCSWTTSGAVSYIKNIDGAGGMTSTFSGTSGSSTFSSTSTNANSFSSSYAMSFPYAHLSGFRPLVVPGGTAPPAGEYWLGIIQSTQTGSTNFSMQQVAMVSNPGMLYYTISTNNYMEIGNSVALTTSNWRAGFGSYSASSNTTTGIALSQISLMASNASMDFRINGYTK